MKITLLSVLFFMTAILAHSQKQTLGIKAGVGFANVSKGPAEENQPRMGFSGGVTYDYFLKKNFSIGIGLLYSQRGYRITPIWRDYMGRETERGEKIRYDYDYLSVPFTVGLYSGKRIYGFANIGIIPSVLINAKFFYPVYEGAGTSFRILTQDLTDLVRKFDLAGSVELGGGIQLSDRMGMFVSTALQRSFTTFTNEDHFKGLNSKHHGITLLLGLKYSTGNYKQ